VPARFRLVVLTVAGAAVLLASAGGCGRRDEPPRDGLSADTARFTYGGRTAEVPLTACGRDGDVIALAGTNGGIVVQAEADVGDGGFDRTGVTADLGDDGILGAFGADMEHGPAGEITDVRVEGDRLIVEGRWVAFDDQLVAQPTTPGAEIEGRLVARCPETDDDVAAPHPVATR
jgi:hypothetical protein